MIDWPDVSEHAKNLGLEPIEACEALDRYSILKAGVTCNYLSRMAQDVSAGGWSGALIVEQLNGWRLFKQPGSSAFVSLGTDFRSAKETLQTLRTAEREMRAGLGA